MDNKMGILLINGAGLNSSIWNDLKAIIKNPILSIEFPNRKVDNNPNSKLAFEDYLNATTSQLEKWPVDQFIIVAHSIGACVGLKALEQFKDDLKGFVAIGSVIPISGSSFVSSLPFPQKLFLPVLLSLFGTKPPGKSIETELCNDLTSEQKSEIVSGFTPESKKLYTTKITYDLPDIKRLYVKLTNDKSISTALQDEMAKNLRATKLVALNSGHLPMLSKPKELAMVLSDFMESLNP
ncbi:MAG: alpha/beta hydrolase [Saprospirales bacterium]|nr:MAG: alpha/beta hydrolase [Saprospirales bacterium]